MKGLELSLAGTVIASIVLFLRRFGRRLLSPRVMCWLWALLLVKLLLPFNLPSAASIENWTDPYLYGEKYGVGNLLTAAGNSWSDISERMAPQQAETPAYKDMRMYQNGKETLVSLPAAKQELVRSLRAHTGMTEVETALAVIWIAGALIAAGWSRWRSRGVRRLIRNALPYDSEDLRQLLDACRQEAGIRRPIRLMRSALPYPALHGWLRPVILLPYDSNKAYRREELRLIFLHELMHHKQMDILLFRLAHFLQLVHWFNPLLRLALRRYGDDLEIRCDGQALKLLDREEGLRYGMLLVHQGELNLGPAPHSPGVYWLSRSSQLRQRIKHIALHIRHSDGGKRKLLLRYAAGLALALLLASILLPANNMYAVLRNAQTPMIYGYWLENGASPRDEAVLNSMAEQAAGLGTDSSTVRLIYKAEYKASLFRHTWNRMRLLAETDKHPWSIQVNTRPIRAAVQERNIQDGQVLLMLQYPYAPIKYWGFGIGKGIMTDLPSLKLLDHIKLY
ncbi:M56 family metallopeptidase [Paenibacillus sinensis]|uniref:M56 family metallopeptidase n=1 Tax=Paenibacillus sinensis TaxID=2834413 RepID=UPI001CA8770B|nr:M56 family metallopeptidase [Paenibacillus sinensis]